MSFSDPDFDGFVVPVWQILINEFILSHMTLVRWMSTFGALISCFVYPTFLLFRWTKSNILRYVLWPTLHIVSLAGQFFLSSRQNAYLNVFYQVLCVSMTWGELLTLIFTSRVPTRAEKWCTVMLLLLSVPLFAFTLVPFQPSVLYAIQYSYPLMQAQYSLGFDFYRAAFSPGAGAVQYLNLFLGGILMPLSDHTWIVALLAFLRALFWRVPRTTPLVVRQASDGEESEATGAQADSNSVAASSKVPEDAAKETANEAAKELPTDGVGEQPDVPCVYSSDKPKE